MPQLIIASQTQVTSMPAIEVKPAGGVFLVKAENPSVWGQPSTWIAVGALIVSVLSLGATIIDKILTYKKDGRARRQSIQDEFWLRKVIFPSAIEPLMLFFAETSGSLPQDSSEQQARIEYFLDFQAKHRDWARRLLLVGTMWPDVYKKLAEEFEKFEDAVAVYCGPAASGGASSTALRANTVASIEGVLNSFCVIIQDHQSSIR